MPYPMNGKQVENVLRLKAPERYSYFVKRSADWQEVWSLRSPNGWTIGKDDQGRELFPVWPHPTFAELCAHGLWEDAKPEKITLSEWLNGWLPDLRAQKKLVSIFPLPSGGGIAVDPARVKDDIESELSLIE